MAKENMLCPFSGRLCRECPLFRGKHLNLCYSEKYRGHLPGVMKAPAKSKKDSNSKFEMPPEVEGVKVLDPFKFDLFDIDTKEQKRRRSPK